MSLKDLLKLHRTTLLDDVMPFWMKHAIDTNGGINSCMSDEGKVLSRDRWGWSQWRAVYVFSKLYNCIEPRNEWLEVARGINSFVTQHGPPDYGHLPELMDGEGNVLRRYDSIYVDGFAIYGLVELWRATRDQGILDLAMQTFRKAEDALNAEIPPPADPFPISPGCISQGISMIFSLAYHELAEATGNESVRQAAQNHHKKVMDVFLRKDRDLVLERLREDGGEMDPPEGTAVVPGHAIESMWFQMHIARSAGDVHTLDRCIRAIRRHLELGWDEEYGGLLLAIDANGSSEIAWQLPDAKAWWPHTEALYATLLAYEHCDEDWCLEWHERIREYSWQHFPVEQYGEWRQKLDRQGNPIGHEIGLPVKDPFHLPRALIYCIDVLERLTAQSE